MLMITAWNQINMPLEIGYKVSETTLNPAFDMKAMGNCVLVSNLRVRSRRENDLRYFGSS